MAGNRTPAYAETFQVPTYDTNADDNARSVEMYDIFAEDGEGRKAKVRYQS
jgi:hypothetical protein